MTSADAIACPACGYHGPVLRAHVAPPWWLPVLACTGIGLVATLVSLAATRRTCPRCNATAELAAWFGPADSDAQQTLTVALERDQRTVRNVRLRLAASFLAVAVLVAIVVLAFGLQQK